MIDILHGDCRETLKTLADESVQCVVTSPPYWGLRDYGTAEWKGGSNPECDHKERELRNDTNDISGSGLLNNPQMEETSGFQYRDVCAKCGALRFDKQIGMEETPNEYVEKMVEVFREVRRVLRNDGTLWLNIGDTYSYTNRLSGRHGATTKPSMALHYEHFPPETTSRFDHGLKGKDLVGVPWRVAFALQADGWYLRQDIIWHKPYPMPESVTDRCTKAHEYVFLLSKKGKYYYDADAIKETGTINKRSVWTINTRSLRSLRGTSANSTNFAVMPVELTLPCVLAGSKPGDTVLDPFAGSGTTGKVAVETARKAILCELNEKYVDLIKTQTTTTIGLGL